MQYKERSSYNLIGLMSGTSLDGLDICYANFQFTENKWSYNVLHTETVTYPEVLLNQLKNAMNLSGLDLFLLDKQVGDFYGKSINQFIEKNQLDKSTIDAIASHGQTIFHQPEKGLTVQIGCGESIAVTTGIKTINDFRKKDVLYGGQGAPLVPIGDLLLFSKNADAFLNIGGFANFSKLQVDGSVLAHDICPANILINYFTRQLGLEYDKDGEIASKGSIDQELLNQLNELDLYYQKQPQSLGWEWIEKEMLPLLLRSTCSIEDKIATVTEHAAIQISNRLNASSSKSVFITGGGAKNHFLVNQIKTYFQGDVIIPPITIIDFKEALIFAFLGVLFLENHPNCVPSVTGASKAVVGGVLHQP